MVEIGQLSPGMLVKIVDQWGPYCRQNYEGKMDPWLGQIVTVSEVNDDSIFIKEDKPECGRHWYWNKYCIDKIVDEVLDELIEPANNDSILSLLFD